MWHWKGDNISNEGGLDKCNKLNSYHNYLLLPGRFIWNRIILRFSRKSHTHTRPRKRTQLRVGNPIKWNELNWDYVFFSLFFFPSSKQSYVQNHANVYGELHKTWYYHFNEQNQNDGDVQLNTRTTKRTYKRKTEMLKKKYKPGWQKGWNYKQNWK